MGGRSTVNRKSPFVFVLEEGWGQTIEGFVSKTYNFQNNTAIPWSLNSRFSLTCRYCLSLTRRAAQLSTGKILLTSPTVINVPTRASLAVEKKGLLFRWLAHLNNYSNARCIKFFGGPRKSTAQGSLFLSLTKIV